MSDFKLKQQDVNDMAAQGEATYWEGKLYDTLEVLEHFSISQRHEIIKRCEQLNDTEVADYAKQLPF